MKISKTTVAKQNKMIEYAKSLGITMETLTRWYKCPIKSSMLNAMAEGI